MSGSLAESLLATVRAYLNPLLLAAQNDQARAALFGALGHTARISSDPGLLQTLTAASTLGDQLSALDTSRLDSWDGLQQLLTIGKQADALIQDLQQLAAEPDLAQVAENLGEEVAQLLLASWLRLDHERVFSTLAFLTIIRIRESSELKPGVVQNGVTLRTDYLVDEFQFDRLSDLVSKPADVLLSWYLPNGMASPADAQLSADRLFPYLERVADAIGIAREKRTALVAAPPPLIDPISDNDGTLDARVDDDDFPPEPDFVPQPVLAVPDSYYARYFPTLTFVPFSDGTTELAVAVRCSSLGHPGNTAGLIIAFSGSFNQTATFDDWRATFTAQGEIPALVFGPSKIQLFPTDGPLTDGAAKFLLSYAPASGSSGPAFVFGSSTGSRLELGIPAVQMGITWTGASGVSALVGIGATACALVIMPGDGDGFLSSILPSNGLTAKFDFGITWSSGSGFAFNGGAGLDTTLPIGLSLGAVNIPSVHLGLTVDAHGLAVEISASLSTAIGPVQVSIDRIGIITKLALPAGGAPHFGDASFSFKPPSGAGLSIDAAGVTGGGFLGFDPAKHEYSGVLQLQFTEFALQAFGLITTQVAGGSGYSLLALIDASFPPMQLGWGFTLNGVGGLVAVHRTADVDALHAALKADKLSTILFPKNAIQNAPQILAQLDALFPTAPGRFLFGPMALIGWGTPTVLTLAMAVIVELPEPIRIVLIARLALRLPSDSGSKTPVRINMDALGILDLSQDQLSLDATLFDSKIVTFTLSGDMALRVNWSGQRSFLLAIGGFHPQFTPPAGFPSLQRITMDMPSGSISRLRLGAYLAVTSNTVQFGAALDVFIGVDGFGLAGHLGFDALLQISPFHFEADISGTVALTAGGDNLISVGLDATLSGPAPWNIAGSFKIHIIFFDVSKHFSCSWGDGAPAAPIPAVDVLPLLTTAFADARNWGTQVPESTARLVSLRSHDGATLLAHPLSRLEVHESVAPLDLQIERFGAAPLAGANTFTITDFRLNGSTLLTHTQAIQDDFAPAQFFNLSNDQELAGPSFEQHHAGLVLPAAMPSVGPSAPAKTTTYETLYINQPGQTAQPEATDTKSHFSIADLKNILALGSAAKAPIRQAGKLKFQAPGKPVTVTPQKFTVTNVSALVSAGITPPSGVTYSEARALVTKAALTAPAQRTQLQILAIHELTAT